MRIIKNDQQQFSSFKNSGCIIKDEEIIKIPNIYHYSRLSNDDYYWIQSRLDKRIAKSQIKGPTIPIKYTDAFTYKKITKPLRKKIFSRRGNTLFYVKLSNI
jgi:hypothetical protein